MTPSKFEQDFNETYESILDVINCLKEKMPIEMVASVLLRMTREVTDELTDLAQWEFVQEQIIDLWGDFEHSVSPHLTNELDCDRDVENYNKRHA